MKYFVHLWINDKKLCEFKKEIQQNSNYSIIRMLGNCSWKLKDFHRASMFISRESEKISRKIKANGALNEKE